MLRIAAPPTLAHWFLHDLLADFMRREPETRIQIEIGSAHRQPDKVVRTAADLAEAITSFANAYLPKERLSPR